jgi:HAD superfamily hydrolase (TIGR01509 family)
MIRAICFDLFETLVTEYIPDYQPSPSPADLLQIEAAEFSRAWATLTPARFRGEIADYPSVLRMICHQVGSKVADEIITQLHEERRLQKARPFAQVEPHILAMLTALRQREIKVGLISNASIEEVAEWQNSELACLFDSTIFSYVVGHIKPEPEIYRLACAALEVAPSETLFIGDGGSDELMGAKQAGLTPYRATWFLDRWPFAKQSPQQQQRNEQFVRLAAPSDLLKIVNK